MKKIQITEAQLIALEKFRDGGSNLNHFITQKGYWIGTYEPLSSFTADEFARLLYKPDSFEVEKPLQIGDYAYHIPSGLVGKITDISDVDNCVWINRTIANKIDEGNRAGVSTGINTSKRHFRRATTKEEAVAVDYEKWSNIEPGDVLKGKLSGSLAIFVKEFPGHGEVQVKINNGLLQTWDKSTVELYAKKVGDLL